MHRPNNHGHSRGMVDTSQNAIIAGLKYLRSSLTPNSPIGKLRPVARRDSGAPAGKVLARSRLYKSPLSKIWNALYWDTNGKQSQAAVKKVLYGDTKTRTQIRDRELHILHYCSAGNFDPSSVHILPIHGVMDFGNDQLLVLPWMDNGNLATFLTARSSMPYAERTKYVTQISVAVAFLHLQHGLIHGDVKMENVFISCSGDAFLGDFGLATYASEWERIQASDKALEDSHDGVTEESHSSNSNSRRVEAEDSTQKMRELGTSMYLPPEYHAAIKGGHPLRKTKEFDVFAFAFYVFEVLTGRCAWGRRPYFYAVLCIHDGERPARPDVFDDVSWDVVERCWAQKQDDRPMMDWVQHRCEDILTRL